MKGKAFAESGWRDYIEEEMVCDIAGDMLMSPERARQLLLGSGNITTMRRVKDTIQNWIRDALDRLPSKSVKDPANIKKLRKAWKDTYDALERAYAETVKAVEAEAQKGDKRMSLGGMAREGLSVGVHKVLQVRGPEVERTVRDYETGEERAIMDEGRWRIEGMPGEFGSREDAVAAFRSFALGTRWDVTEDGDIMVYGEGDNYEAMINRRGEREDARRERWRRQEQRAGGRQVLELMRRLGVSVTFVDMMSPRERAQLSRRQQRAKGWYDPRTGRVYINLSRHSRGDDVVATFLHEVVARKGLRELFGKDFDTFLNNVFNNVSEDIRKEIVEMASRRDWDFLTATEEYLALLAQSTDFDDARNRKVWSKVINFFMDLLRKAGITLNRPLSDNELRYILWRSYNRMEQRGVMGLADDMVMRDKLDIDSVLSVADDEASTEMQHGELGRRFSLVKMSEDKRADIRKVLEFGEATNATVRAITSEEGLSARNAAMQWAEKNLPEPIIISTEIGDLVINKKSISDSLAHGFSQAKLDAIPTLVPAFKNKRAVYIGSLSGGADLTNHYFAYPIDYNGERDFVFCRTREDANTHRLYVHEVITKEDIEKEQTLQSTARKEPRTGLPLYRKILSEIFHDKGSENSATGQEDGAKTTENGSEKRMSLVGGNKGYVGYSMSKRAEKAREEGRYPKTDFKREYKVSSPSLDALTDLGVVENSEWHHTSKYGNETTFYGWSEENHAKVYADNKKAIDALAKEYVDAHKEFMAKVNDGSMDQAGADQYTERRRELQREIESYFTRTGEVSGGEDVRGDASQNETTSADGRRLSLNGDREYAEAVARGDREKVDKMLRAEAERKGYKDDVSYQGSLAFNGAAPSRNAYYETKEERIKAFREGDFEGDYTLGDFVDNGLDNNDLGWQLENPIAASGRDKATLSSIRNLSNVVKNKRRTIKMYRAIDANIAEGSFRNGDWVTPSREYAERHIGLQDWENGRIIEQEVPIDDIWWNGDDINEWGYDDGKGYVYKNTENNRKLLEPTYDDQGNLIPLSQRFNDENPDIRFSLGDDRRRPTFYSNAERAVENVKQEKAKAEQWKAMLTKAGGIKTGEDKWMGLSQRLDEHKGESLSKDDVLGFVRDNGIRMEEREYSEEGEYEISEILPVEHYDEKDFGYTYKNYRGDTVHSLRHGSKTFVLERDGKYIAFFKEKAQSSHDTMREAVDAINAIYENIGPRERKFVRVTDDIDETRINYTTEGLENKREIAFVVPDVEPYQEGDSIHFGPENEGRAVMWVRFGETTDADGKRVLVIDEIQSNRHQEGKKRGYRTEEAVKEDLRLQRAVDRAQDRYDNFTRRMGDKYDGVYEDIYADMTDAERAEADRLERAVLDASEAYNNQNYNDVPAAPFEKNWHEVAMKRMLRLAAEEGFDKVAWTTGMQQAERYDLGKMVDEIRVIDAYDGVHEVMGFKDGKRVFDRDVAGGERGLSELIGKDMARKAYSNLHEGRTEYLVNDAYVSLTGKDLAIGGEGMRGFYDQMLPRFMDKYGKKWGVKTGEVTLDTPGKEVMHSVDVTPEMKESVMQGQPLFSLSGGERVRVRIDNGRFNEELDNLERGELPNGHIFNIGRPASILRSAGFPDAPIELSATKLAEKARQHGFAIGDVRNLAAALQDPVAVFAYGDKGKAQNVIVEIVRDGKNFVVGVHFNQTRRGVEVSDIRGLFPKDNAEWLNWINQGKLLYVDKEKIQTLIDQQRTNPAEVAYLDLDSVANLVNNFENPSIQSVKTTENGRKYSLSGGAQTHTENFKLWFGDWENDPENASKVVDENGEPKVVLHNTPNEFYTFNRERIGSGQGQAFLGYGFNFSRGGNSIYGGREGKYQDITPIDSEGFRGDMIDPAKTADRFHVTEVADEEGARRVVDAVQESERERLGGTDAAVDYGWRLSEKVTGKRAKGEEIIEFPPVGGRRYSLSGEARRVLEDEASTEMQRAATRAVLNREERRESDRERFSLDEVRESGREFNAETMQMEERVKGQGTGRRYSFSRSKEEFDQTRERAVREKGIVAPGLANKNVEIVEVKKTKDGKLHPFDLTLNETKSKRQVQAYAEENGLIGEVPVENEAVYVGIFS